jgi:hypothetical protein
MPGKKRDERLERLLKIIQRVRSDFAVVQTQLRTGYQWLLDVEKILSADPPRCAGKQRPGEQVAAKLDAYLLLLTAQGDLLGDLATWRAHFVSALRRFWPGLFHCYDQPLLPRTNNEIELYYHRLKRQRRRNTGRKGTQDYLVRYGPYLAYDQDESEAIILSHCRCVDQASLRSQRLAMRQKAARRQVMWRFRHRRDAFCADLKRRWEQLAASPSP